MRDNKIPKIEFVYSTVYDINLTSLMKKKWEKDRERRMEEYTKRLEKAFGRYRNLLKAMEEASGLKWQETQIKVYPVKYAPQSYSHPLTVKVYRPIEKGVTVLVHELVHNLTYKNPGVDREAFNKAYKDEPRVTRNHILQGAILVLLNRRLFGRKSRGFFRYDNWTRKGINLDYIRTWRIVSEEGADNLLKRFVTR